MYREDGTWYDTPEESRSVFEWCPECDPSGEDVPALYTTRLCGAHGGFIDSGFFMSGASEAGGEDNIAFCKLFHARNQADQPAN